MTLLRDHLDVLRSIFHHDRPELIVEVGVLGGDSLEIFLDLCEEVGHRPSAVGVDPWEYANPDYEEGARAKLEPRGVRLIKGRSPRVLVEGELRGCRPDLVHIDGDHAGMAPFLDMLYWKDALRPGGAMLVHDILLPDGVYGVAKAWQAFKPTWETWLEDNRGMGLGIGRKRGTY